MNASIEDIFRPECRVPSQSPIIKVGQRVYCGLYGGRNGVVVRIHGQQSPETVKSIGGVMVTGGMATFDVIFDDGSESEHVPESIIRYVQWIIYDSVADTDQVIDAVQFAKQTAEQRVRDKAEADQASQRQLEADMRDEGSAFMSGSDLLATAPAGAKSAIVAVLDCDDSDSMSDYFAHKTVRSVVIGWTTSSRVSFAAMRKAAAKFCHTSHMGPGKDRVRLRLVWDHDSSDSAAVAKCWIRMHDAYYRGWNLPEHFWRAEYGLSDGVPEFDSVSAAEEWMKTNPPLSGTEWDVCIDKYEHRENYSMGGGYYLKAGGRHSTGWKVTMERIESIRPDGIYQVFNGKAVK